MIDPELLEKYFNQYTSDLGKWLPDGVVEVDLELLQKQDLLHFHKKGDDEGLTRYFHVIEADEKLTLINEQFVVWIVPDKIDMIPVTLTLIALNNDSDLQLELAFTTSGIYNNSQLVLRVLEKFLMEIQNTEELLKKIEKRAGKR